MLARGVSWTLSTLRRLRLAVTSGDYGLFKGTVEVEESLGGIPDEVLGVSRAQWSIVWGRFVG